MTRILTLSILSFVAASQAVAGNGYCDEADVRVDAARVALENAKTNAMAAQGSIGWDCYPGGSCLSRNASGFLATGVSYNDSALTTYWNEYRYAAYWGQAWDPYAQYEWAEDADLYWADAADAAVDMAYDTDEVVRWYGLATNFHPYAFPALNEARMAQTYLDSALWFYDRCLASH